MPAQAIYGGEDANLSEFPFMVAVVADVDGSVSYCGGTVISQEWVLTAAHCVIRSGNLISGSDIKVYIGANPTDGAWPASAAHSVGNPILYSDGNSSTPNYLRSGGKPAGDAALLRLSDRAPQSAVIGLSMVDYAPDVAMTAIGWGDTADQFMGDGSGPPEHLQKLDDVMVRADAECFADIRTPGYDEALAARYEICTKAKRHGLTLGGPRHGDSGGPLLHWDSGHWTQVGIASFLPQAKCLTDWACGAWADGDPNYTGWTDVAYIRNWINTTMTDYQAPSSSGSITTALIIDSSGSMTSNDPNDDRKDAAKAYLTVSPNDDAGVVDFDDTARVLAPAESVSGHRAALESAIDQIDSDGGTDLGAGLQAGCDLLGKATTDKRAAIFFTDGEGSYNDESSCYAKKGWRVYTIGLGDSVDESLLKQIAADTHGRYFHLDAGSNPVCEFQQIRAEIAGGSAADCKSTGTINLGQTIAFIQKVISGLKQFTFTNTWSGSDIKMTLTSPSGKTYDRDTTGDPGVVISRGRAYESFTILDPEPGDWHVSLYGADIPEGGEAYTFSTVALPKDDTRPPTPPAPPTTTTPPPSPSAVEVQRIAGKDRYATAAALSAQSYQPGVQRVFVASGEAFADALGGGAAAAAAEGPLLLVKGGSVPDAVAGELHRLAPKSIVVLGGSNAVTDAVLNALKAYTDGPVERWAGDDRYGTAVATAEGAFPTGAGTAYVASGLDFPDGLAGTPGAAKAGGPLLLTRPDMLPAETAAELQKLGVKKIVVLGGRNAVSDAVLQALGSYGTVSRISGADRYGTAAALTQGSFPTPVDSVVLTTGTTFPDALSGGAFAGGGPVPLLITKPQGLPKSIAAELARLRPAHVIVLGGTNAVSQAVADAVAAMN